MIPGGGNPAIWGGDPCELHKVSRSLKLQRADSPQLSRVISVAGNRKTFTLAFWIKRTALSINHTILRQVVASGYDDVWLFDSNNRLNVVGTNNFVTGCNVIPARQFKDMASHVHVVIGIDTTQAVAADRVSIEIDGIAETAFNTAVYPALNYTFNINAASTMQLFWLAGSYPDAIISEPHLIDGFKVPASEFGFHCPSTRQWRKKPYLGAYGAQGWHLDFSDNSAATALALGADRSGNGNNFTPTNISVAAGYNCDSLTDTTSSNFCTMDPNGLLANITNATLTEGNLTVVQNVSGSVNSECGGTIYVNKGKWYWEAVVRQATNPNALETMGITQAVPGMHFASISRGVRRSNGNKYSNNVNLGAFGTAGALNDVYGFALDMDAGTLTVYRNGVSMGQYATGLTGYWAPWAYMENGSSTAGLIDMNFGQRPFAQSAPALHKTLCHANLPTPLWKNPARIFTGVTDSGANVVAALAAARADFGADYIEIFKRRDSAEGWRWRFSDDPTFYLDSETTAAKQAFPVLGGTSYVGYAFRRGFAFGIESGTFVHVNGVASVITENMGTTRKVIMVKREDAAGVWPVYHPDLTAGKLLYLGQTTTETTDASISAITSNSFTAAAALPSGTYRWIAIAETSGLITLGKHIGNGNVNGTFSNTGVKAAFQMIKKSIGVGANWTIHDRIRDPYNTSTKALYPNLTNAEAVGNSSLDLVSNGYKNRSVDGSTNGNGDTYISIAIADFPFKYSNAR